MEEPKVKKKVRIGDIRRQIACCSPRSQTDADQTSCCGTNRKAPETVTPDFIPTLSTEWTWQDYLGQIKCRVSSFRNSYTVNPGLYAVGEPDTDSDVFVSANYKLSFDILRRTLKGMTAWILVLDTKGINVWCAAGKGTFGTDELVKRIGKSQLENIVSHRRIIVPQLGAPGVAAHTVQQKTGFRVCYGPVDARDIRRYVEAGYKATEEMRRVKFTIWDRFVLTPMEMIPALKIYALYALFMLFIISLKPSGIIFKDGLANGLPFIFLGLFSVLAGALVTPMLLPFVPFRSFAVKGWIVGLIVTLIGIKNIPIAAPTGALYAFSFLFFPLASSYIALQFTGSTVFTGMSGVKKELKYAMPIYISAAFISLALLIIFKLNQWGVV